MQPIIFTDLDGTLLNSQFSFSEASESLQFLTENNIPLILCSSKTRAEIELYRERLENAHPFIAENGAAIFIPKNYFDFPFSFTRKTAEYDIIEYGVPYATIRKVIKQITVSVQGFGDMSADELIKKTGLPIAEAHLAKKREYSEPFLIDEQHVANVKELITKNNLTHSNTGTFHQLKGQHDKGTAVSALISLLQKKFTSLHTLALGDDINDFPMLNVVDNAFLLPKSNGGYDSSRYGLVKEAGPEGWNNALLHFFAQSSNKSITSAAVHEKFLEPSPSPESGL